MIYLHQVLTENQEIDHRAIACIFGHCQQEPINTRIHSVDGLFVSKHNQLKKDQIKSDNYHIRGINNEL